MMKSNNTIFAKSKFRVSFQFIQSLNVTGVVPDENLIQKICAAIDVNSFEVRGPAIPAIGCAEVLRGVYLKAALLAHDCVGNTHMSINDNNVLVCHASIDIKKGDVIYYNYTDPLKVRITQIYITEKSFNIKQHLMYLNS